MISRVSLFNSGIFKSTIKRNLWGSVIYFILLFLFTAMPLISDISNGYIIGRTYNAPLIFEDMYLQVPVIISVVVPTIVAMLVYRFVHSKRTAVFVHSLPVTRDANYISTLAAAFVLMAAPVVANGIVLGALSVAVYSQAYSLTSCIVWVGINLLSLFVMFSIATFAAVITGNTIATAVLNLLLHTFVIIIVACFGVVARDYLYGYVDDGRLLQTVLDSNPAVWICSIASRLGYNSYESRLALGIQLSEIPYYIAGSVVLYAAGWYLYKKRGMESAEDIAAFRVLNPIFKYFVTFMGTMAVYAVFNTFFYDNAVVFFLLVFVLAAVIYFACEMLLRKTFRVWHSYKGYICFAALFGAMLCVFAFTDFFGFETRVPDVEDIDSVAIYNYYYREDEPYVHNSEIIQYAHDKHQEFISFKDIIETNNELGHSYTRVHFKYKLKGGGELVRAYQVKSGTNNAVMTDLYTYDDYVVANESIFRDDKLLRVTFGGSNSDLTIADPDKAAEFVKCVQQDVMLLSYNEMYIDTDHWNINFEVQYEMPRYPDDGPTATVTAMPAAMPGSSMDGIFLPESSFIHYEHHSFNANYKNTIKWLRDNGYGSIVKLNISSTVSIVDMSKVDADNDEYKTFYQRIDAGEEIAVIDNPAKYSIVAEYIENMPVYGGMEQEYCYHVVQKFGNNEVQRITCMTKLNVEQLLGKVK